MTSDTFVTGFQDHRQQMRGNDTWCKRLRTSAVI